MAKSKIIASSKKSLGKGVSGADRRWRASRLENVVKNKGIKKIKK